MKFISLILLLISCTNPLGNSKTVVDQGFSTGLLAPTISTISNQSVVANESVTGINFTISDNEEVLNCVTSMSMISSNTTLIDNTDVVFSGVAPNCSAAITPNANEFGTSNLSFVVSDGSNSSTETFSLDVSYSPSVEASISVWLDGKDSATTFQDSACVATPAVIFGDSVGCWVNKVSGANSAIQAGVNKPTIGNNGVSFDGADDILTIAGINYDEDSDLTIFVAIEVQSQSTAGGSCCRPFLSFVTASAAFYPWLALTRSTFAPGDNLFHGFVSGAGLGYVVTAAGDPIITSALHDGTNKLWNAFSQGVTRVTNQTIPATYTTTTGLGIGGDPGNAVRKIAGEINEIIITEGLLGTTERERVEGYLACKYDYRDSLDSSHPFYHATGTDNSGCL